MKKKNWFSLAIGILPILILVWLVFQGDTAAALAALKEANLGWMLAALGCIVAYWLCESGCLWGVTRQLGIPYSGGDSLHTTLMGQLFNNLTPFASGGQPIQVYDMTRRGVSAGRGSGALLLKFILYQGILTVYCTVLLILRLPMFFENIPGFGWLVLVGYGINCSTLITLMAVGFFPGGTEKLAHKLAGLLGRWHWLKKPEQLQEKIAEEFTAFGKSFRKLKYRKRILLEVCVLTVIQLTFFFALPYFICRALGAVNPDFISVIAAASFVLLVSSFVPLPGAAGGAESSFYLLFAMFFTQSTLTAVAVLLWRLLTFCLPILVGLVAMYLPLRKKSAAVEKTPPESPGETQT